jgi:site-specific DNA recombinase
MQNHRGIVQKSSVRAAIYIRVSSDKQEEDGTSLESQLAACQAYCKEHGYIVVEAHIYQDVYTGTEYRYRPGLNRLLKAAEKKEFDVVVFNSIERLSRKLAHQIIITELLTDNNVSIESVTEDIGDSSPYGQMFRSILSAAGEIELERLKERIDRGKRGRVTEKKVLLGAGPALYGYKWNETRTAYLINDEIVMVDANGNKWSEAKIAIRIFDMASQGISLRKIAFTLSQEGIFNRKGTIWGPNTISTMLSNISYIGKAVQYKERITKLPNGSRTHKKRPEEEQIELPDGIIPPLVTTEIFHIVQQQLARNKQMSARNNKVYPEDDCILRCGLVVCGLCGSNMFASRERLKDKQKVRYMCRTTNALSIKIHFIPELDRHYLSTVTHVVDDAAWKRAQEIIRDPDKVKLHVEAKRAQVGENPSARQLEIVDNNIAKLAQTLKNLDRQITRLSEQTPEDDDQAQEIDDAIDSIGQRKGELRKQKDELEKERLSLLNENDYWLAMKIAVEKFEVWCNEWREKLECVTYAEKRYILEFLSIRVKIYKADHNPPYEIESEPLLNCVPDHL